jgi:type IV pilus assembly protein PilY1
MWEFTSQHDADLGHTFSAPLVALLENGRWAAIFGNGYEDTGSGEAQLFILYLDGGLDGSWSLGTDYLKISTAVGDTSNRNGLGTPGVVDMNGNGAADRVYAGDLEGNMWVFDLSDTSDTGWEVAYQQGGTPKPLFTAASDQPITSKPILVKHPTVGNQDSPSNAPNVLVLFGTGQYLVVNDKDTTHPQSFYGVWDEGTRELDRNDLVEQTFASGFAANIRVVSDNDVPYTASDASKRYGWYLDLPDSGERAVVSPAARGDVVFFNTLIPSNGICQFGGSGWLMAVSTSNGGRPDAAPFDVNGDKYVNEGDLASNNDDSLVDIAVSGERFSGGIPAESAFLSNHQYTPDSSTSRGDALHERTIESLEAPFTGRLSWEELQND